MKCPQRHRFVSNDQGGHDDVFLPCIEEECAWWDEEHEMCCVVHIGDELGEIQWELQETRDKLPPKATLC